ncbi:MAG TPA: MipA/OmpV family protein [Burkholderiales bacterium]|nr:MipA/OmpV family protein [Burkholderiales bacterium]
MMRGVAARLPGACFAALLCLPVPAVAMMTIDILPNMIGAGVGATPAWSGSKQYVGGIVPGGRYQFRNSERFVEWYGPMGDVNLLESSRWQLGPALGLRFGRSHVEDEVVTRLPEVDSTVEGGLMASWTYTRADGIPWRLRLGVTVMADLGHTYEGLNTSTFATFWLPLSRRVFVGLGGGFSLASADYNRRFYGVDTAGAAASGLPAFTPGGGLRQWYAWPAIVFRLQGPWYAGVGVFYQRIAGDPADSPIITQRGDRNQVTGGIGVGYVWQ